MIKLRDWICSRQLSHVSFWLILRQEEHSDLYFSLKVDISRVKHCQLTCHICSINENWEHCETGCALLVVLRPEGGWEWLWDAAWAQLNYLLLNIQATVCWNSWEVCAHTRDMLNKHSGNTLQLSVYYQLYFLWKMFTSCNFLPSSLPPYKKKSSSTFIII